jgi:hypothetical protein
MLRPWRRIADPARRISFAGLAIAQDHKGILIAYGNIDAI